MSCISSFCCWRCCGRAAADAHGMFSVQTLWAENLLVNKVSCTCPRTTLNVLKEKLLVAQSHLTLQPMDCSPPGFSVHGILQAEEWVAIPFSRGSSQPRD